MNTACPARPGGPERGSISALVLVVAVVLLISGGLVIDGGAILAARREAIATADAAARAGAQALEEEALRSTGTPVLDPALAHAAANAHLAATGHSGGVAAEGARVTVTVSITQPMQVLGVAGIGSKTVTGTSTVRAVRGVTTGET
ncbi:MAG: pilus assembly protein TadG-related protein [Acidimicrobiia bacterium]